MSNAEEPKQAEQGPKTRDVGSTSSAEETITTPTPDSTSPASSSPSAPGAALPELDAIMSSKLDHLFSILEPFVHQLDEHVVAVANSQELLNQQLEAMLAALSALRAHDLPISMSTLSINSSCSFNSSTIPAGRISNDITIDIEDKSRRLLGLKRRLTLVHSILSTVNSRVKKMLLAHNSRINWASSAAGSRDTE